MKDAIRWLVPLCLIAAPARAGGGAATAWLERATVVPPNGAGEDAFGSALSLDGSTLLVGSPNQDHAGEQSGRAYLLARSAGAWTLQQVLDASDAAAGDRFGRAVALQGATAVVGAPESDPAGAGSGAVYVFVRTAGAWSLQQKLVAPDAAPGDAFGCSVALDAETVLVGARGGDDACPSDPACDSGAVYVFTRSGSTWSLQQKLLASDAAREDWFGHALGLQGDLAVVGAPDDVFTEQSDSGAAYVFARNGSLWTEVQRLEAPLPRADDEFGRTLALAGATLLVGAPQVGDLGLQGSGPGSVHVFEGSGGAWTHRQELTVSNSRYDAFGFGLALESDLAVVGALSERGAYDGAAHVFERTAGVWERRQKLVPIALPTGAVFGWALDLAGRALVVGAPLLVIPDGIFPGAVLEFAPAPWASFCDGGDGALAACPCGNPGDADSGCADSGGAGGMRLDVWSWAPGRAWLGGTLDPALVGSGPSVLVRAAGRAPPAPFGDGVLCLAAPLVRVDTHVLGVFDVVHGAGPGTFDYQVWYRDPNSSCTPATFILSNGVSVTWP